MTFVDLMFLFGAGGMLGVSIYFYRKWYSANQNYMGSYLLNDTLKETIRFQERRIAKLANENKILKEKINEYHYKMEKINKAFNKE